MIRLGIIGCGNMTGQHLNSFEALKKQLTVSVVCDLNAERAERAMEILGAERFDTDYHNILDDVDAVLIALPHQLHYPVGKFFIIMYYNIIMALQANIFILNTNVHQSLTFSPRVV